MREGRGGGRVVDSEKSMTISLICVFDLEQDPVDEEDEAEDEEHLLRPPDVQRQRQGKVMTMH